jgi:hypothetical protein
VDVGPLVMARALEALALLNIMLQIRNNRPWQAGFKAGRPHLMTGRRTMTEHEPSDAEQLV